MPRLRGFERSNADVWAAALRSVGFKVISRPPVREAEGGAGWNTNRVVLLLEPEEGTEPVVINDEQEAQAVFRSVLLLRGEKTA